jgi:hypothetical protein
MSRELCRVSLRVSARRPQEDLQERKRAILKEVRKFEQAKIDLRE